MHKYICTHIHPYMRTCTYTHIHTRTGTSHVHINPIAICILNSSQVDGKKLVVDLGIVFMTYLALYWSATNEMGHYEVNRKDRGT